MAKHHWQSQWCWPKEFPLYLLVVVAMSSPFQGLLSFLPFFDSSQVLPSVVFVQVCNQFPNFDTFSLRFLSLVTWMVISSMAFTNSTVFSMDVSALVDLPVSGRAIVGGTVGAKEAANVKGTVVEAVGITVWGVVANSLYLNCIKLSSSFSISFSFSFSLRTKSISSSSLWVSNNSVVCGWCRGGNLSYFFNVVMSSFFFLIRFFAAFPSLGSCPSSMIKSSRDFILVSLACEEAFYNWYCVDILFSKFFCLCAAIALIVKV